MKKSISTLRLMVASSVILALLSACNDNNPPQTAVSYAPPVQQAPAPVLQTATVDQGYTAPAAPVAQVAPATAVDPGYATQPAPVAMANPYALVGCPGETNALNEVLAGIHGVDQWNRPLNACGIPVNVYGEPVESYPAPQVFYAQPSPIYLGWLRLHYPLYHPLWGVGFYHPYFAPGVIINRTYYNHGIPRSAVTRSYVQTNPAAATVRVPVGSTQTVRPGATVVQKPGAVVGNPAANAVTGAGTVKPGAVVGNPAANAVTGAGAVKPGAVVGNPAASVTNPATVMPKAPVQGTSSVFNRPVQNSVPNTVAKPVAPAANSVLNRPVQSSPAYVVPKAPAPATTSIFNRPSNTFNRPINNTPAFRPSFGSNTSRFGGTSGFKSRR